MNSRIATVAYEPEEREKEKIFSLKEKSTRGERSGRKEPLREREGKLRTLKSEMESPSRPRISFSISFGVLSYPRSLETTKRPAREPFAASPPLQLLLALLFEISTKPYSFVPQKYSPSKSSPLFFSFMRSERHSLKRW